MLQMHLMPKCIWCVHFVTQNVTNAFDAKMHFGCAKMHLMQKCIFAQHHILLCKMFSITFCWCKNAFDAKMHFGCAKMHLMQKCIFAYILRSKMFSITFSKGKCSAKQNVTNAFDALQKYIFASHFVTQNVTNAFDAKMHLMRTFCNTKCYKCIWCQNAFWLCKNAFDAKMHFCTASHFTL